MSNNNNIREYTAEYDIEKLNKKVEDLLLEANKIINFAEKIANTDDYSKYTHISNITEFNGVKFNKPVQFKFNMKNDGDGQYLDGPFVVCDDNQNYIMGLYDSGELHGEYKHWEHNNDFVKCNYKNGKLHGRYLKYNLITGYHIVDKKYKDGKLHGEYRYYKNGILIRFKNYTNGNENGVSIYYYDNGNKKMEGFHRSGWYYGKVTEYNKDGSVYKTYWKNGHGDLVTKEKFIKIDSIKKQIEIKKNNKIKGLKNITFV